MKSVTTDILDIPRPIIRSRRAIALMLSLIALAAVVFAAGAALPYLLSPLYGPPEYAPRRGWLLFHIVGGMIALLTGPLQLWLGLADRGMAWHRRMGIGYMTGVGIGSSGAFYLSTHTDFGWVFGAGLFGLAVAWVTTTTLAYLAIKRSLTDQHKEWMIRSYVVTFAFVTFRVIQPALQAAHVGTIYEQLAVAAWACWAVPLLFTELVIQGRKVLGVRPH
ncbi:MAG TPA: DUF2306 domain-containing protein [Vicinamibacterales bacterium]|nr:DUF2306 domain-containing protein [Vicinamibacterales bacterium]